MMKHLLLAGGVLGSVALAGCGINGKINATPTGNGTYHVSGTVHTTGPSSTSSSSTPSSSNPTHSSSGISASTSSSSSPSHNASSTTTFSSVIQSTMQLLMGHIRVPLYAPTSIRDFTPSRYYSAAAHISQSAAAPQYTVTFYKTSSPMSPNSSALQSLSPLNTLGGYQVSSWPTSNVASQHLFYGTAQPPMPPRTLVGTPVTLEAGLIGKRTTLNGSPAIEWREGRWTFTVIEKNTMPTQGVAMAQSITRFCQTHFLPPPTNQGNAVILLDGNQTSTQLSWNAGTLVLNTSDHNGWLGAFETAVQMHKYGS